MFLDLYGRLKIFVVFLDDVDKLLFEIICRQNSISFSSKKLLSFTRASIAKNEH